MTILMLIMKTLRRVVHQYTLMLDGRSRSGRRSYEVAMVTEISPSDQCLSTNIWLLRTLSKYKLSMNF